MIKIGTAQLWVQDQDEALAFYKDKVGFEVRSDVTLPEMGDFRWLTVAPPDHDQSRPAGVRLQAERDLHRSATSPADSGRGSRSTPHRRRRSCPRRAAG